VRAEIMRFVRFCIHQGFASCERSDLRACQRVSDSGILNCSKDQGRRFLMRIADFKSPIGKQMLVLAVRTSWRISSAHDCPLAGTP
jgi:RNase P/RNase MRP subunit POP5